MLIQRIYFDLLLMQPKPLEPVLTYFSQFRGVFVHKRGVSKQFLGRNNTTHCLEPGVCLQWGLQVDVCIVRKAACILLQPSGILGCSASPTLCYFNSTGVYLGKPSESSLEYKGLQ